MQSHLTFNQRDLGHGATDTILHPAVAVALLITIILLLVLRRKYVIVPLLITTFLVPRGQVIVVAGLHFYVQIILIMVGFVRLARSRFQIAGGLNIIDKAFILWAFYRATAVILTNWPNGIGEQLSFLVEAYCGYFLLRHLIQNEDDIVWAATTLSVATAILGLFMLYEHTFDVDLFGYLGGVPLRPEIRDGVIRAQATFGHPILAGCFGGTLLPLFFWLWKSGNSKTAAVLGTVGSTLMVLNSNSSTPVLAYAAGVLGLCLWPLRRSMRLIRWSIVGAIVLLALAMKAPVWFIVAHVNVIGGSGGYDRAYLIDVFMRHIRDWWLIGTNQNGNWGYDMWDLSNQFVAEGEMGGIVTFICFIAMISYSFKKLGNMRRRAVPEKQWLFWCLGAVMLANIFAYFGVAYWDQTRIWWFTFLAMISAATVVRPKSPIAVRCTQREQLAFYPSGHDVQPWVPSLSPSGHATEGTANQPT